MPCIAALIIEPVPGNIGPVLPKDGYLKDIREITRAHDVLLIFDEVITGYRLGIGGAQVKYSASGPILRRSGRSSAGGFPSAHSAAGGRSCSWWRRRGPVYQAGTFSGNPLSLAAGIATVRWLHDHPAIYPDLSEKTRGIEESLTGNGKSGGSFVRIGSMFKYFFRDDAPQNYIEVKECDTAAFTRFWQKMLKHGIFLPPSQFETNFLSAAHTSKDLEAIAGGYAACR